MLSLINDIPLLTIFPYQLYSSIVSDNGFSPTRQQAIVWTNDG